MRFSFDEIKKEISDNWEWLNDNQHPEDALVEFADTALPVYYSDILKDWAEMPSEFNDSWQDYEQLSPEMGIFNLMTIDLSNYYGHQYSLAYRELCDEKENN